jgi:hypothetical protein
VENISEASFVLIGAAVAYVSTFGINASENVLVATLRARICAGIGFGSRSKGAIATRISEANIINQFVFPVVVSDFIVFGIEVILVIIFVATIVLEIIVIRRIHCEGVSCVVIGSIGELSHTKREERWKLSYAHGRALRQSRWGMTGKEEEPR